MLCKWQARIENRNKAYVTVTGNMTHDSQKMLSMYRRFLRLS